MDKFPEAFRRFERVVDTDRIRTFDQLLISFRYWAGRNWEGTRKQVEALKVEADRLGIPVSREIPRGEIFHTPLGSGSNITEIKLFIETSLMEGSYRSLRTVTGIFVIYRGRKKNNT